MVIKSLSTGKYSLNIMKACQGSLLWYAQVLKFILMDIKHFMLRRCHYITRIS